MDAEVNQEAVLINVLLFEIGGRRYAVDSREIQGIGRAGAKSFQLEELGALTTGKRALIFTGPGMDVGSLLVDSVEGIRDIAVTDLRRMPKIVSAHPYALGVWLDGDRAVLLIDLHEGFKFHLTH